MEAGRKRPCEPGLEDMAETTPAPVPNLEPRLQKEGKESQAHAHIVRLQEGFFLAANSALVPAPLCGWNGRELPINS